jgi:cytoskeletal protein RodZ
MSLEALERSDLSRLPGGIFTRAFIRAYAQEVGLDPERTIQDFIAELPPDAATATAHPAAVEDSAMLESDRKAVTTAIRLVLFSVPIIGLVTYYGTQRMPLEPVATMPRVVASPLPVPEPVAPQAPPEPLAGPVDAAAAMAAPISELTLEMAPRDSCWVSVTADGDLTFSGLMNAGDKRVVTAKELILLNVGDAGAFVYALNGRPGRPLGAPGAVVSKRITLSNISEFVAP